MMMAMPTTVTAMPTQSVVDGRNWSTSINQTIATPTQTPPQAAQTRPDAVGCRASAMRSGPGSQPRAQATGLDYRGSMGASTRASAPSETVTVPGGESLTAMVSELVTVSTMRSPLLNVQYLLGTTIVNW